MALNLNDHADDRRDLKRNVCNHGEPENPSVDFLKKKLKEQHILLMEYADSDYLNHLNSCISAPGDALHALLVDDGGFDTQHELAVDGVSHGPQRQLLIEDLCDDLQHRLLIETDSPEYQLPIDNVCDYLQHRLPIETDGEDPLYALFLSRLEEHGISYMVKADETLGLTEHLIYHEDKGQEDSFSHCLIQFVEPEIVDGDYASFCAGLRSEGSAAVYQCGNGPTVVYHGLDLPNLQMDTRKAKLPICIEKVSYTTDSGSTSRKQKSNFPVHKEKFSDIILEEDDYCKVLSPKSKMCSNFKVQIMRILSKPYDKEEHDKLMLEITLQKPQIRHMDLRSAKVRFSASKKKGKSYLDHHADLKRKIEAAAEDKCKQLNLLRGFFFWIQNLADDEAFIPWKNEECLAVQPQSC